MHDRWERLKSYIKSKRSRNKTERPRDNCVDDGVSANLASLVDALSYEAERNREEQNRDNKARRNREYITIALVFITTWAVVLQERSLNETLVDSRRPILVLDKEAALKPTRANAALGIGNYMIRFKNVGKGPASLPFAVAAALIPSQSVVIPSFDPKKGNYVVVPTDDPYNQSFDLPKNTTDVIDQVPVMIIGRISYTGLDDRISWMPNFLTENATLYCDSFCYVRHPDGKYNACGTAHDFCDGKPHETGFGIVAMQH